MYGLINRSLQSMIRDKFGDEQWEQVLTASGVPDDSFLTMRSYDDSITYALAGAASEVLGAPVEDCMGMFGEYWVLETATKSYGSLMDSAGGDMLEFLRNMNALHDHITSTFIDYVPPQFQVEEGEGNRYLIHYISKREGLTCFCEGLLRGLAQRFDTTMIIHEQRPVTVASGEHTVFEISLS